MKLIKKIFNQDNKPNFYKMVITNEGTKLISKNIEYTPTIENLKELIEECAINKGVITNPLVFIENEIGLLELIAISGKKYKETLKRNKLTLRDIKAGDEVKILNINATYIYLGSFNKYCIYKMNNNMRTDNVKIFLNTETQRLVSFDKTPTILEVIKNINIYSSEIENINKIYKKELIDSCNSYLYLETDLNKIKDYVKNSEVVKIKNYYIVLLTKEKYKNLGELLCK